MAFLTRVLSSWQWWGFVVLWIIAGETESFSSNSLLALYMKSSPSTQYTVAQLNDYPTGVPAIGIVSTLFWATLTDFLGGKRYLVGYFIGITGIATSAMILAASQDPTSAASSRVVFAAYYWAGAVYACQATFFAWANDSPTASGAGLPRRGSGRHEPRKQRRECLVEHTLLRGLHGALVYCEHTFFRKSGLSGANAGAARNVCHDCRIHCSRHLDGRSLVEDK